VFLIVASCFQGHGVANFHAARSLFQHSGSTPDFVAYIP
jgi:hypothetical protein